jgi:PAS domain S-box-containing protein
MTLANPQIDDARGAGGRPDDGCSIAGKDRNMSDSSDSSPHTTPAEPPADRRPRVSRPTPSHLFAERRESQDGNGQRRTTRVIPALANAPEAPSGEDRPADRVAPGAGAAPNPAPVEPTPEYPPDLVLIVRADGAILYVNRPLGRRGEEDIIGTQFYDWVFPDQHQAVREALERVFTLGRADGVELSGMPHHETEAWFECRIAPNVRDGRVVSATVIARDVSRYRQVEQALRTQLEESQRRLSDRTADLDLLRARVAAEREHAAAGRVDPELARFRAVLDGSGEAVFIIDPETEVIVDINDTACRWLRHHRAELLGARVADLELGFPILPPVTFDVQFTETRDNRRPLILDGTQRRQDGSMFPVEVAVISERVDGRDYTLAVARDVKDRRRAQDAVLEAEQRYRALLEQAFDAVYLTTRAGEIVDANRAAFELFGYRRDEMIGMDARAIMPAVDDIRRFQRTMATEGFVARLEVTLRRRDGTSFPAALSASRRRDAQDRLLGYQWVARALERAPEPAAAPAAAAPVPAPAEVPATPAPPAPGTATDRVVLLVGGELTGKREEVRALERAGLTVAHAEDAAAAIHQLRERGSGIRAAVVQGCGGAGPAEVARDLRALEPELAVVLVFPAGVGVELPPDLDRVPLVRAPVHPLALVQAVREALELR